MIDNAIKFSENDSLITVEVSEKNEKVFISVKDHGIGIPRQEQTKIWERFYKSDLSRGKDQKRDRPWPVHRKRNYSSS